MGLIYQFHLIQAIRNFFLKENFLDVLTPPIVQNPGIEPHIHPYAVRSIYSRPSNSSQNIEMGYLHTSPEFAMKHLLAHGFEQIFTISYCFRDEPISPIHRSQFIMLEWYRSHARYERIMEDCEKLIPYCHDFLKEKRVPLKFKSHEIKFERYTIQEIFREYLNIDILNFMDKTDLRELIKKDFPQIPLPNDNENILWEDYYFLLFLNCIESELKHRPFLMLYEYPKDLCALATLKADNPKVCERFEIYIQGIEIGNCYNELTDIRIQRERFQNQNHLKNSLYHYRLPEPQVLLSSLEKGVPPSAGIAFGVERLLMGLTQVRNPFFDLLTVSEGS